MIFFLSYCRGHQDGMNRHGYVDRSKNFHLIDWVQSGKICI
jgi:hypothetical protein